MGESPSKEELEERKRELLQELKDVELQMQGPTSVTSTPVPATITDQNEGGKRQAAIAVYTVTCLGMILCGFYLVVSPFGGPFQNWFTGDSNDPIGAQWEWLWGTILKMLGGLALLIFGGVVAVVGGLVAALRR